MVVSCCESTGVTFHGHARSTRYQRTGVHMASLEDTTNPAGTLIAAHQVQGTTVYNIAHEKLGSVEDIMIDKASGRIAYAVLSFGGFLGIGDRFYPLPWEKLRYNTQVGGYVVDVDRETLEGAPSYTDTETASWDDKTWGRDVYAHYGVHPFWDVMP
jgi:sporulation protein YlmC with PRC-barrel domain